jgi:cation transport regulator ChaC
MKGDRWYFAYGSNLFVDQKEDRTGHIRQVIRCRLPGYRFAFNQRGKKGEVHANIVPEAGAEVWGVIYLCNPAAFRDMDDYEGVASGDYRRLPVHVIKDSGEEVDAIAYIAGDRFVSEPGKPSGEYLERIISGARHHELPEEYIERVEALGKGRKRDWRDDACALQ